jgi:hypothetical protein
MRRGAARPASTRGSALTVPLAAELAEADDSGGARCAGSETRRSSTPFDAFNLTAAKQRFPPCSHAVSTRSCDVMTPLTTDVTMKTRGCPCAAVGKGFVDSG